MKQVVFLFLMLFGSVVHSAELVEHKAKVTRISGHSNTYTSYSESENGVFFIFMEGLPNACGNGMGRIAITHNHPLFSTVVSAAMLARTTGEPMTIVYLNSCTVRNNSWDFGSFTF